MRLPTGLWCRGLKGVLVGDNLKQTDDFGLIVVDFLNAKVPQYKRSTYGKQDEANANRHHNKGNLNYV